MDALLEHIGAWLATANAIYGLTLLAVPAVTFAYVPVLAVSAWVAVAHARGRRPFPAVTPHGRRWVRMVTEVAFGLVNPVIYLIILSPAVIRRQDHDWRLAAVAWVLLAAFWVTRLGGAAFDRGSPRTRAVVRGLLLVSIACVAVHAVRDTWHAARTFDFARLRWMEAGLILLRLSPLYLVPLVLLVDYLGASRERNDEETRTWQALFVLPTWSARLVVGLVAVAAVSSAALTLHRRSETSVRSLVASHHASIDAAAARYDVDPRLLAALVYVAHRDEVSPFRETLERVAAGAWAASLRFELGFRAPDRASEVGPDENPLLNEVLDVSVGLAQVKPRTAQTASVLATGRAVVDLPDALRYRYLNGEPSGEQWRASAFPRAPLPSPIPMPATRADVTGALLDDRSNVEVAALVLALYQRQWEAADPSWRISTRPEILATLFQLGFARSRPHAAPRSSAFGRRVRDVSEQRWMLDLFQR